MKEKNTKPQGKTIRIRKLKDDAFVRLRVPQEFCTRFFVSRDENKKPEEFMDIMIPTEGLPEGVWRSWVVRADQVFTDNDKRYADKYYIIDFLYDDSQIEVYNKKYEGKSRKKIEGSEEILSIDDLFRIYKEYNRLVFRCPHCNEVIMAYSKATCAGHFAVPKKSLSGSIVYRDADFSEEDL